MYALIQVAYRYEWPALLLFTGVALFFAASATTQCHAQSAAELSLENIFTERQGARDVALSPNGRWAAVTAQGEERSGIYLIDLSKKPERAWAPTAVHPSFWVMGSSPQWDPGSQRIVFARGGEVWTASVGEQRAEQITEQAGSARDPVFSPDGKQVAFYSEQSGYQDLWLVPSEGKTPARQLTEQAMSLDDPRFEPAWSPDGKTIAFVSNKSDYWSDDVWLVNVSTGEMSPFTQSLMASSTPVWSPEGNKIALFGTAKDEYWYQDLSHIYVLDLEEGTERIVDMPVYATDAIMRNRPIWSEDGEQIYFPYQQRGSYDLWAVPAAGGVATRVTNLGGVMRSFSAPPQAHAFVFVRSGPTEGPEVYYLGKEGGPARQLTRFSQVWSGLQKPEQVSFRTYDGKYIQGFLYRPYRGESTSSNPLALAGGTYPALVQVHGGGTNSYLQNRNFIEQYLASKGYVVLAINYRGGSGFGRAFQDLAVEDWLNGQAIDAVAAADYLRGLPYVNGDVGIYGGSYGGSMTMAAITRMPDAFDAAVAMRGAYSKTETFEQTDRLGKIFTKTGHGGLPEERPEVYAKSNTIARIKNIKAPVLLMHGEKDQRVPFRHYQLALEELRAYDKVFESKSYPEEGHGFRNPENAIDMYGRLEAFFDKHLAPAAE